MRFEWIAIPLFHNDAKYEYQNSRKLTSPLTQLIKDQYQTNSVNKTEQKSIKTNIKMHKEWYKATLAELQTHLNESQKHLSKIRQEKGVFNELTVYTIKDQEYGFNKPSTCSCRSKMDIQHAMNCKKGGFTAIRYNYLWVDSKSTNRGMQRHKYSSKTSTVAGETFNNQTVDTSNKASVNIQWRGFWVRGQQAFFDVRIFDPNTNQYLNKALPQAWFSSVRLNYFHSLLHNITSNRTGVNAHFYCTENNLPNFYVIISENKKETFRF